MVTDIAPDAAHHRFAPPTPIDRCDAMRSIDRSIDRIESNLRANESLASVRAFDARRGTIDRPQRRRSAEIGRRRVDGWRRWLARIALKCVVMVRI
jgi:hypothetical protein